MEKKRTKIVATISDKMCEPDFLRKLFDAGMDVIRINSAHCNLNFVPEIVRNARMVSDTIAVLIDTKGPEVRCTESDSPVQLKKGNMIDITGDPDGKTSSRGIFVTYPSLAMDVPVGSLILFDDGDIALKVIKRRGNALECRIENDGLLGSRKSMNVPGVRLNLPSVTEKDKKFLEVAVQSGVDFVAHSFVRSKEDIRDVREVLESLNSKIKIIAKIENQDGIDNLDDIIDNVYGIMVARGDLGIEIPYEKIPVIQKMIINKCIIRRKPVIVATQMLHSMINNPRPTRAEVTDIASAIYSQADALMLSGETATGKYPLEAVKTMTKVALEVERNKEKFMEIPYMDVTGEISSYLAKVAVKTAYRIGAKGIISDTVGGRTIRNMASYRGINLILAQCYSEKTMRELALSYGVYASYQEKKKSVDEFIHIALKKLVVTHKLLDDDLVVVLAGNFSGGSGFSFMEVGTVQYLKDRVNLIEE